MFSKPVNNTTTDIRNQHLKALFEELKNFEIEDGKFYTTFTFNGTVLEVSKKFPDIKFLSINFEHSQFIQSLVDSEIYGVEFFFKPDNISNIYTINFPDKNPIYYNWTKFTTSPAKFIGDYQQNGSGTWVVCDVKGRKEKYFILVRNKEVGANHTPIVGQATQSEANNAEKHNFEYSAPNSNMFNPEANALKELSEELGNLIDLPTTLGNPIAEFVFNNNNKTLCYVHTINFTVKEFNHFVKKCEYFENPEVGTLILASSTFIANIVEERFLTTNVNKFSTLSNDSYLFGYNPEAVSKHWFLALQYHLSDEQFKGRYKTMADNLDYCKITLI